MDRSRFLLAAALAILGGMATSCERHPTLTPTPTPTPAPTSASSALLPQASTPGPAAGDLPIEDQYQQLKALFDSIPPVFRDRPERPLEDLVRDVESGIEKAEEILAEAGTEGSVISFDGSERGEVEFMLAHLLFVSFHREVAAGRADGLELSSRALELVQSAALDLPEESPRKEECLLLAGRLYQNRAAFQSEEAARHEDLASTRECILEFLRIRPDWGERSSLQGNVADSHLIEGSYAEARSVLEAALAARPRAPGAFYLEEKLFDALTGCGDLEAMEALVLRRQAEYPRLLEVPGVDEREKEAMAVWIDVGEFWIGHIRYALGNIATARNSFQRQIATVDAEEAALRSRGEKIGDVARIYRDLRSRRMVSFIDEKQGKQPALDFDLGERWATAGRTTLAGSRGKVVAAMFRNPGDQRSADFLRSFDGLWRRRREQGLEAIVVGFLGVTSSAEEQVRAMREDLEMLGVGIPAGIDPGLPDPPIFRAMGAIVGSPSFIALDRRGRIAWFLPDPRPMDAALAARVIERLLAVPAP